MQLFAPGKIMLSGEYAVLQQVPAIALPTKMGQHLHATPSSHGLQWQSFDPNGLWFEGKWDRNGNLLETTDSEVANRLSLLFRGISEFNPGFKIFEWNVTTKLDFPRSFGLGSSSSLIALVGEWSNVSAMDLFFKYWKGSGYDVAVAVEKSSISYQLLENSRAIWQKIEIQPTNPQNWRFVYSRNKQSTYAEIDRISGKKIGEIEKKLLLEIHEELLHSQRSVDWLRVLERHEQIIADFIGRPSIMSSIFPDAPKGFFAKSLGAWGGDFFLVYLGDQQAQDYLKSHKYTEVYSWNDFIA